VTPLTRGLELLETAVGYAFAGAGLVTLRLLPHPTPCPGWDLATLDYVSDSIGVLHEAITAGGVGPGSAPGDGAPGPTRSVACAARHPGCWPPAPLPGRVSAW